MRVTCALSGLNFNCEYFSFDLTELTSYHPIFDIPQKQLLKIALTKWVKGDSMSEKDSYLLFLALLNSTKHIEFRVPVKFGEKTTQLVASNMEKLIYVIGAINSVASPAVTFPKFAVTKDSESLANISHWLAAWEEIFKEFKTRAASNRERKKLADREAALTKIMRSSKNEIGYASKLADWAQDAASFPKHTSEYWKKIIRKCVNAESIFSIPEKDLKDLISWCEENLEHGSIFAHSLMELLRKGAARQANFLGFGEVDIISGSYKIVELDTPKEKILKEAQILAAPETEPKPEQYPNKLAYVKAKARWLAKIMNTEN